MVEATGDGEEGARRVSIRFVTHAAMAGVAQTRYLQEHTQLLPRDWTGTHKYNGMGALGTRALLGNSPIISCCSESCDLGEGSSSDLWGHFRLAYRGDLTVIRTW